MISSQFDERLKDENLQVAEDFARMAELGYMDKEFTAYGCVFFEKGKRRYLISADETKIIDFIIQERALLSSRCPTDMMYVRIKQQVPLGQEENILNDVKRQLGVKMQKTFSEEFF